MNRSALWIVVSAAAAVFFGWNALRAWTGPALPGEEPGAAEAFSRPAAAVTPQGDPGGVSYAGLSSIVARPVFRPDRRPYQEGTSGIPQRNYEAELARYTLIGVLMAGDEKKGVVVSKGHGAGADRWEVGAGDTLADFTVKEVGPDGLTLVAGGKEFTLPLYAGGPKSLGGAPIRTETAPAPQAVQPPPPPPVRTFPGRERIQPPPAPNLSPAPVPPRTRTDPRRYIIPGRQYTT